ncbi:toll/interleukin-1 receptor domain-containing protein [Rhizobium sp. PP-CC-3G-465]|uniref:toll/interleukin-1 receptor domain-containing protein n=1 Tax=Rhizobium sp. PP-CC-3G-465 TaxID=2135648 RepID=UPI001404F6DC
MADIFVSHCVADKKLAERFVSFLKEAIGVPAKSIFCSSVGGHDIPLTVDFNDYMKEKIRKPKLVITLMTPRYMESWFCLMELGAAWSLSHKTLAIVVPPITFDVVTRTLGLKQGFNIQSAAKLIDLRQTIHGLGIALEIRTEQDWEKKRAAWNAGLKKLLRELPPASSVSSADHKTVQDQLVEVEKERDSLQDLYSEALEKIEDLMELKDKEDVKAVLKKHGDTDLNAEVDALIDEVGAKQPKWMTKTFFIDLLMDYFDKPTSIDWSNSDTRQIGEIAIQKNWLSQDPPHEPEWNGKIKSLGKAIKAVKVFFAEVDVEKFDDDAPTDCTDRDFWEYHL